MNPNPNCYALLFEPSLQVKVWGGRQLETRLGKALSSSEPVGESWEVFWKNRIKNGPHRGKTLGELISVYPEEMLGRPTSDPEFPLLIKLIDVQEWVSVQVHPDDALAAKLEGQSRGKTECWYIIDAVPGAEIAYGLSEQLDANEFRNIIEAGQTRNVLQYVAVAQGDFIYVPAGTLHAVGPGILFYELQQTSDTTYRVYDWDRPGLDGKLRELHIEKSLICTHYDVRPKAQIVYHDQSDVSGISIAKLLRGDHFSVDKLRLNGRDLGTNLFATDFDTAHCLTVINGRGVLRDQDELHEPVELSTGTSVFVPARLHRYTIDPIGEVEILRAWTDNP